ncbi:hypothetical protein MCOR27_001019 [Pyricularia oryzae]|nr:hypothetical protein MCOR01_003395 [Pyricularia oryzae]KAI6260651.1 hypothetical protein MCOR19_002998 [Pyricularia oryzae]KAI6277824.1 hypothetical protein MCOR26_004901 [Pyricularia oryzae]KAI6288347.1 hypothetical protein MCOR27_001019 [Pyricularia oryzae]KAI6329176.1 hypothetical protein MCOR30_005740 [Pyricularia oryzae]
MSYAYYDRLIAAFAADNGTLQRSSLTHSTIGMVQYFYYIYLTHADGIGPLPLWMHLFYLAHDTIWAYIMFQEAPRYDYHPYFTSMAKGLVVWSILEVYCIYRAIVYEKEGLFGQDAAVDHKGDDGDGNDDDNNGKTKNRARNIKNPTVAMALMHSFIVFFTFFCLVLTIIYMVGRESFPHWTLLTKILACTGAGGTWLQRGTRRGTRMSLALLSVVDAITCFWPYSRWVLVWPEVFDNPAYYLTGVCCTLSSVFNVYVLTRLPKA